MDVQSLTYSVQRKQFMPASSHRRLLVSSILEAIEQARSQRDHDAALSLAMIVEVIKRRDEADYSNPGGACGFPLSFSKVFSGK